MAKTLDTRSATVVFKYEQDGKEKKKSRSFKCYSDDETNLKAALSAFASLSTYTEYDMLTKESYILS